MFKIEMPNEIELKKNYSMLIYGKPGTGKTTTALSAKNPILLDLENGMDRVPGDFWQPRLDVDCFEQILEFVNSPEVDRFDTIIIDPMEKLIDKAIIRLIQLDPRMRMSDGSLILRGYTSIKMMVKDLLRNLAEKKKNLIFVAHSEERENEKKQKEVVPCMGAGSSGREILNMLDIIGYMDKDGDEVELKFSSTDLQFYSKMPYNYHQQ